MTQTGHSFDWKGFKFFLLLPAGCLIFAAGMHIGVSFAAAHVAASRTAGMAAASAFAPIAEAAVVGSTTTAQGRMYDMPTTTLPELALASIPVPKISAPEYLVADVDTGDVYAQKNAAIERPIASITKLMTALVASESTTLDHKITLPRGELSDVAVTTDTAPETFTVGDLLYPMLMESNNNIADRLAAQYGTDVFVARMNQDTKALDMASTTFVDASGVSRDNVSTPEDLYRLAVYLADDKPFVWDITSTPTKTIVAKNGSRYSFTSFNEFSGLSSFVGGKIGETAAAGETMVSIFAVPVNGQTRRIAVIILDSDNDKVDTQKLADWFGRSATALDTACVLCALPSPSYQKISL